MQNARTIRNRILAAAMVATLLMATPVRAHAVSKEIIQLQTQVQQLLDMVQRLQTTMDTRFAVQQNLAQQTANQAVAMNNTVNTLQQKLNVQNEALSGKMDSTSGQIQSLNDSVDELKARIAKLQKSIQDMQGQLQNIQSQPAAVPGAQGQQAPPGTDQTAPGTGAQGPGPQGTTAAQNPAANQAPPLAQTFQAATGDYNAARYDLATSEFQDVIHYYPMNDMAGTAQYYLGEIAYHQHKYEDAIQAYNAVLEGFSGNAKAPAAQLHKGYALIELHRRSEGIHELRALIQRYPQTPEGEQARHKLNAIGVRITPR
ncbi:MAG TPA: tetratricopeptide repeat protein [Terracidiphilus sp.]|nr:tetratricopeptide repeat protein [Terracidiphilus sp.]